MSETQDLLEGNGTRPVIGGTVGHSTLVSNKQWIVIQVGLFECRVSNAISCLYNFIFCEFDLHTKISLDCSRHQVSCFVLAASTVVILSWVQRSNENTIK